MHVSRSLLAVVSVYVCMTSGCGSLDELRPSSKWAMDHPDYAAKYDAPYPTNDARKNQRLVKQMVDARHVEHDFGTYQKAAYSNDPDAGMLEAGFFTYPTSWSECHTGISILAGERNVIGFPGIDLGVRFQSPSRLAPFVGLGVYSDLSQLVFGGDDPDFRDHFAAVYPEIGFHSWWDGLHRTTLSAGYHFSSNGRDSDYLMLGLSFSKIRETSSVGAEKPSQDVVWYENEYDTLEKESSNEEFCADTELSPVPERE